nr:serine/arginine repetitive matrix protein 1-like [Procambarus clarkii]
MVHIPGVSWNRGTHPRGQLEQGTHPRGQLHQGTHPRGQQDQGTHPRGQLEPGYTSQGSAGPGGNRPLRGATSRRHSVHTEGTTGGNTASATSSSSIASRSSAHDRRGESLRAERRRLKRGRRSSELSPQASGAPKEPTAGGPKAGAALTRRTAASTARGKKPLPRPDTRNGEGSDTAGGRAHSSTCEVSSTDDSAGAGEDAQGSEEFAEGDEVAEAKGRGGGLTHHNPDSPSMPGDRKRRMSRLSRRESTLQNTGGIQYGRQGRRRRRWTGGRGDHRRRQERRCRGTKRGRGKGRRRGLTHHNPRNPREGDDRRHERQASPLQQHPRPPRKQPAADAPPQPPNDEDPKQKPPGPQSSTVGQTYQGQMERQPKLPQEPNFHQDRASMRRGSPMLRQTGEVTPPRKPREPQHEERHSRLPHGPQHHTGNKSVSGPDKRPGARARDTKLWTEWVSGQSTAPEKAMHAVSTRRTRETQPTTIPPAGSNGQQAHRPTNHTCLHSTPGNNWQDRRARLDPLAASERIPTLGIWHLEVAEWGDGGGYPRVET